MKKKLMCILFTACWYTFCFAQQALTTTGGEADGTGGTVSFTIGQVAYTADSGTEGVVYQGVQQLYEIFDIGNPVDKNGIHIELSVFPNPARELLKLTIDDNTRAHLTYYLFNSKGQLLESKKLDGVETNIRMDMRPPGIYFIKATDNHTVIKTFKIIKY